MSELKDGDGSKARTLDSCSPRRSAETAILEAVRSIRYGSVEVTIHDSRVVQIECKEKLRFQT